MCIRDRPYDEGWRVFVNGQNVKTYSVNGGFVGFGVEAGNNQIEMYFTPVGFKQGAIISLIGIMGYVALIIHEKLKTRNSRRYKMCIRDRFHIIPAGKSGIMVK